MCSRHGEQHRQQARGERRQPPLRRLPLSLESEVGARQRGQITKGLMSYTKGCGFSPKGAGSHGRVQSKKRLSNMKLETRVGDGNKPGLWSRGHVGIDGGKRLPRTC